MAERNTTCGADPTADEVRDAIHAIRKRVTAAVGDVPPAVALALAREPEGVPLPLQLDARSWRIVRMCLDHTFDAL